MTTIKKAIEMMNRCKWTVSPEKIEELVYNCSGLTKCEIESIVENEEQGVYSSGMLVGALYFLVGDKFIEA